jgi:hypothetical protein
MLCLAAVRRSTSSRWVRSWVACGWGTACFADTEEKPSYQLNEEGLGDE